MQAFPEFSELKERLMRHAALVDRYDPEDLLRRVLRRDQQGNLLLKGQLLSALRKESTIGKGDRGEFWQLRPISRRKVLSLLQEDDALPDTSIATALRGQGRYSSESLRDMVEGSTEIAVLEATVAVLEQAGPGAPGHGQLQALTSRLDSARQSRSGQAILGDRFVGRGEELALLTAAIDAPQRIPPLRALHIQGLPGVGKTYLLEEMMRQCRDRPKIVMIRLDFDRSALQRGDPSALIEEIAHQVGTAIPEVAARLHRLSLEATERRTRTLGSSTEELPFDLLYETINTLADQERQILFVLDTLEVLHAQGRGTLVHRLLDDIDRYADKERLDITVISAGRGPIFEEKDSRLQGLIRLDRLDEEISRSFLLRQGVPEEAHEGILRVAGGNPLRLKLATEALLGEGADGAEPGMRPGVETGYLYRAILSRVPVDIRIFAAEGLILPEVGVWELQEILGPAFETKIDEERAKAILEALSLQRWLVEKRGNMRIAHDPEARAEILETTYLDSASLCHRINAQAAAAFDDRDPVLALYHRLQMTRDGTPMPDVPRELARQFSDSLLNDLPRGVRSAVLRARGQQVGDVLTDAVEKITEVVASDRTFRNLKEVFLGSDPEPQTWLVSDERKKDGRMQVVSPDTEVPPPDPGLVTDLRNLLETGDKLEASHLLRRAFASPFALDSDAGLLAFTHQWQSGRWSLVRALLTQLPQDRRRRAIRDDLALTGLALLEAWAEFEFDGLRSTIAGDDNLAGQVAEALSLTQRSGLRDGALAMAFYAATEDGKTLIPEPFGRYISGQDRYAETEIDARSHAMRSEFGLSYDGPPPDPNTGLSTLDYARMIAPLTPYAEPLRALLDDMTPPDAPDRAKILQDTPAFGEILPELAELMCTAVAGAGDARDRTRDYAQDTVVTLRALGLTAEFAGGYAFYSPIPDLPHIARAAERWQAASLGLWRYDGDRPHTWLEQPRDALVAERAEHYVLAPHGFTLAQRALIIWDDPYGEIGATPAILKKRIALLYQELEGLSSLDERLDRLAGSSLTPALQAPIAALSELGVPAQQLF